MQKVQLIDVESSKRNAALPLHLACRGKLTDPVLPSRIIRPSCVLRAEMNPTEAEKSNLYISCALHMKANWQKMIHCNELF